MRNAVLFNVAWMREYQGPTPWDKPINGGKWVEENGEGAEMWNFLPANGVCRGYVRSTGGGSLDLRRLGGSDADECADGVTVIFSATRRGGGRVVVGWYKDARVWRSGQRIQESGPRKGWEFIAEAAEGDCFLLRPDDRVLSVPRAAKGVWGVGQANVRYLDEPEAGGFLREVANLTKSPFAPGARRREQRSASGFQADAALRVKIEKAAVEFTVAHYEGRGFSCRSVESERLGWDLVAERSGVRLLVEVKGCSGDAPIIDLTPNEFAQMLKRQDEFRLAIVINALDKDRRRLVVVAHNLADGKWRDESGNLAHVEEKLAARVSVDT